jgi:hypothetical protein
VKVEVVMNMAAGRSQGCEKQWGPCLNIEDMPGIDVDDLFVKGPNRLQCPLSTI